MNNTVIMEGSCRALAVKCNNNDRPKGGFIESVSRVKVRGKWERRLEEEEEATFMVLGLYGDREET